MELLIVVALIAVLVAVQQQNTNDLARLLGVPRFDDNRLSREVAALARSLTRTDSTQLEVSKHARKNLEQLRAAIDSILKQG